MDNGESTMATTKDAFNALVNDIKVKDFEPTLDQMFAIEQSKLLRSINGKLTVLVVLAVIGAVLGLLVR